MATRIACRWRSKEMLQIETPVHQTLWAPMAEWHSAIYCGRTATAPCQVKRFRPLSGQVLGMPSDRCGTLTAHKVYET